MSLRSGLRNTVATAPIRRASFALDPSGGVRFADGLDERNFRKLYYRKGADAEWRLVNDAGQSGFIADALGMSADGHTAYVRVSMPEGPDAIET